MHKQKYKQKQDRFSDCYTFYWTVLWACLKPSLNSTFTSPLFCSWILSHFPPCVITQDYTKLSINIRFITLSIFLLLFIYSMSCMCWRRCNAEVPVQHLLAGSAEICHVNKKDICVVGYHSSRLQFTYCKTMATYYIYFQISFTCSFGYPPSWTYTKIFVCN